MSRVLLVAMDAADGSLVRRWMDEGKLPTLAGLAERGFSLPMQSIAHRVPDAVWPALLTGCMPGTTGHYSWRCVRPGTGAMVFSPSRSRRRQFWELVHDHGHRVLLADVPKTRAVEAPGTTALVGWGSRMATRRESAPPELYEQVVQRHGRYPTWLDDEFNRSTLSMERYFRTARRMIGERTTIFRELLDDNPWDLAVVSYPESHSAGHVFYRYLDPSSWCYDPRGAKRFGDRMLAIYSAIDEGIGELIASAPDADVIVFSAHGMAPNTSGVTLLPRLLERLGYAVPTPPAKPLPRALLAARSALPWSVRRFVNRRLSIETRTHLMARLWSESIDWTRTRAVAEAEFGFAWIRVNLRGREPGGIVAPGDEYDKVRGELVADVCALTDEQTGEPAAAEVLLREELFDGPHAEDLPDIFVRWAPGRFLHAARHPRAGLLRERMKDIPTTEHCENAFLVGAGPRLRASTNGCRPQVIDLAPTVLALAGAPIPEDMEGQPLEELLGAGVPRPRRAALDWEIDPWAGEPQPS